MDQDRSSIRRFSRDHLRVAFRGVTFPVAGRVTDMVGTIVEAHLPGAQLGTVAKICSGNGQADVLSEVVGFRKDMALLLPFTSLQGISAGARVYRQSVVDRIPVGDFLLGKVVNPFMQALDGSKLAIPEHPRTALLEKDAPNPMSRPRIANIFGLGVRAIDTLLTFGEGQRLGIMAGSGVGKSVLMGMMARDSDADVNVIALIGERGREVKEFIEKDLGPEGLAKSVVVCVTSDQSPLMRIRGAKAAQSIAEYFSERGKKVLLFMDSLTRVAMAQREIGLAIGEPPTTKGYPPSVFSLLPKLLERCGPQGEHLGSISGIYTVLVDGDDFNDPIPDAVRAILDGHINLSRDLASKGHFPAIEIPSSASRVMYDIVPKDHWQAANHIKGLLGTYQENFDYIQIGSYQPGSNPKLDLAVALMPELERFVCQDVSEGSNRSEAVQKMMHLASQRKQPPRAAS